MGIKYSVVTFGCRVNQADSLQIEEGLRARGGVAVASHEAELVVVNTCSVTATADQGARQTIRRIARDNPAAEVVVTGCYATRRPAEVGSLPGVVRVIPNHEKDWLVPTTAERYGLGDGACGATITPGVAGRTAYTLRVQTGCDQECSYCIIPTTRGRGRSLAISDVVRDVERAAAAGFREIALTGVHLGSYGRDVSPATSLAALLRALDASSGDVLFRVSSLEPMDCTPEVLDILLARGNRFAPHFHLPLQHASDRLLTLMRRPYTAAFYRDLAGAIAERVPHASIGTDVIAGFPGETDAEAEETVAFLERLPLSHVHVFPYSDRPGTVATALSDKIPGAAVRERGARLRAVGARLTRQFREAQVGTIRSGLTIDDGTQVMTDNYLKVAVAPGHTRNERVLVRIEGTGERGTIVTR